MTKSDKKSDLILLLDTLVVEQPGGRPQNAVVLPSSVTSTEKTTPRRGWAAASKELAAREDDALVLPVFANESDAKLKW